MFWKVHFFSIWSILHHIELNKDIFSKWIGQPLRSKILFRIVDAVSIRIKQIVIVIYKWDSEFRYHFSSKNIVCMYYVWSCFPQYSFNLFFYIMPVIRDSTS